MKRYEKEIRDLLEQIEGFPENSDSKKKGNVAPPDELFAQAARREREQREAERQSVTMRSPSNDDRVMRSRPLDPPAPIPFPTGRRTSLLSRLRHIPLGIIMTVGTICLGIIGIAFIQARQEFVGAVVIGVAALVFLSPSLLSFFGRSANTSDTMYWRGQSVSGASGWSQARAWFNRPFAKRSRSPFKEGSQFPKNDPWNRRY